jgi:hypothetical protein
VRSSNHEAVLTTLASRYTAPMQFPPKNPTPAFTRFQQSMIIDYDAWRDGTPYDVAALSEITTEERHYLTEDICARASLDWRDVEALRAPATPKALKRIGQAAASQTDGAGVEAFSDDIAAEGWTPAIEKRFIAKLSRAANMEGALDRLYDIAEQHPTEAVRAQLLHNARASNDPAVRYSMGAFLLYLAGHVDTRHVFDKVHRPHLLDLNSDDQNARQAAIAWLGEKLANPKR